MGSEVARKRQSFSQSLCSAAIYGKSASQRSQLAQLSRLVAEAATAGDAAAKSLFTQAAAELADIVDAVHDRLRVPPGADLPVSCTGGLFQLRALLLAPFESALLSRGRSYRLAAARLPPDAGAAVYASKLAGAPLAARCIAALETRLATSVPAQ
jgi:N-acetylglucosamine kinase-like BadF-type ATPase